MPLAMYETPTSGGKANAISVAPPSSWSFSSSGEYIVLTDDEQGFIFVLSWDAERGGVEEVARTKLGGFDGEDVMASHAIWLG